MVVAGDIGSKNSFLGIFQEDEKGTPVLAKYPKRDEPILVKYPTTDYDNLESLVEAFLQQSGIEEPICAACFGISGPVSNGTGNIVTKKSTWNLSEENLCDFLIKKSWKKNACDGAKEQHIVRVINSLEGIDFNGLLNSDKITALNQPNATEQTVIEHQRCALLGVRDNLGEALVHWGNLPNGDEGYVVSFSEGGHSNFAPSSKEEVKFLNYLLEHSEYLDASELVTYQDVLSRKGIVSIYRFVQEEMKGQETLDGLEELVKQEAFEEVAEKIMIAALNKENAVCEKAIDLFFSIYGAEAGNLALKYYARGGVYYIRGALTPQGLMDKLINKLQHGTFMRAFTRRAKGTARKLLESIPVKLIDYPRIRLFGAARLALDKEDIGCILHDRCE